MSAYSDTYALSVFGPISDSTDQDTSLQQLINWFSNFHAFVYDPTSRLEENFNELAIHCQWSSKTKAKRWPTCVKVAFAALYADDTEVGKLEKWQDLCRELHITNPPASITKCKKVLKSRNVRVNIVNLINHRLIGEPVIRFKTHDAFLEYTTEGRMIPRGLAKEDGFLQALLRQL